MIFRKFIRLIDGWRREKDVAFKPTALDPKRCGGTSLDQQLAVYRELWSQSIRYVENIRDCNGVVHEFIYDRAELMEVWDSIPVSLAHAVVYFIRTMPPNQTHRFVCSPPACGSKPIVFGFRRFDIPAYPGRETDVKLLEEIASKPYEQVEPGEQY